MGFILSKFRRKKSTQDILEGLEKEIKRISNNKRQSLVSQSTVVKKILIYGLIFWVLAFGCVFYLYRSAQRTEDYIIFLPILFLIPTFLFFFRRVSTWWYHSKISKDDDKLTKLKEEKSKLLDEVMEKETYKVATQILEKYDPSRLPGKSAENQGPGGRPVGGAPGRPQPMVVAASPHGGRQPITTPRGGGMDLRKRPIPGPGQQSLNQSMSIPQNRKEGGPVNMNQTIGAVGRSPAPQQPPGYGMGRGMPPGGMSRGGGPPLPRPVIPRERGVMDRVVEYLVGDGPSNRYALICRQCQSHNGMALREEFEYISYRCCYCHYWNPARKQRPVAPRLPDPPPTPPTPVTPRSKEPTRKPEGSPKLSGESSNNTEKEDKTANDSDPKKEEENKKGEGSVVGASADEKASSIDGANADEKASSIDGAGVDEHELSDNHEEIQGHEEGATASTSGDEATGDEGTGDEGTGDAEDYDIIAPQDNNDEDNQEDIEEQHGVDAEGDLDLDQPPSKSEHIQLINKDDRTRMSGYESTTDNNITANRDESMEVDS